MNAIELQLRENMRTMQERLAKITPPKDSREEREAEMIRLEVKQINKLFTRSEARDEHRHTNHNHD